MADPLKEIRTYLIAKTGIQAVLSETPTATGFCRIFTRALPEKMPQASKHAGAMFKDSRDLPAVAISFRPDEDYAWLGGAVGMVRGTMSFECYSLQDTGSKSDVAVWLSVRNEVSAMNGLINSNLWIYDSDVLGSTSTEETSTDKSTKLRRIQIGEVSVTYQEVTTTIGI